jgi:hypothetical protein
MPIITYSHHSIPPPEEKLFGNSGAVPIIGLRSDFVEQRKTRSVAQPVVV